MKGDVLVARRVAGRHMARFQGGRGFDGVVRRRGWREKRDVRMSSTAKEW